MAGRIRADPWILDQSKNILSYLVYFILFITGCVGHNVIGEIKNLTVTLQKFQLEVKLLFI